jgi:hypothetical protein
MSGLEYLRERAAEYERLAEEATNPDAREIMLQVAARWQWLADEDEAEELRAAAVPSSAVPSS